MCFLEQQNKITTNSIDEHHKSNELDLIICGKTNLYIIKGTIKPISKSIVGEYYNFYGIFATTMNNILLCAQQFHGYFSTLGAIFTTQVLPLNERQTCW